jgi:hypothetical protein
MVVRERRKAYILLKRNKSVTQATSLTFSNVTWIA